MGQDDEDPATASISPKKPPYRAPLHQVEVSGQVPEVHWPRAPMAAPREAPTETVMTKRSRVGFMGSGFSGPWVRRPSG